MYATVASLVPPPGYRRATYVRRCLTPLHKVSMWATNWTLSRFRIPTSGPLSFTTDAGVFAALFFVLGSAGL
jgi:hypothetical protein